MRTFPSIAMLRRRFSARLSPERYWISAICVPIDSTGLSAVIGSWNTAVMRSPRSRRSPSLLHRQQVGALEADPAAGHFGIGGKQPDHGIDEGGLAGSRTLRRCRRSRHSSPTGLTSRSACTRPSAVRKSTERFSMSSSVSIILTGPCQGAGRSGRGASPRGR